MSLEFGLSLSKSRLSQTFFLQVLCVPENSTTPGHSALCFVFVLAWSLERTSRHKWLQHCERFLYLLLGSDKMFFSASLLSLLYQDNILFQLCLFFTEGSGVCCPTLIHTLNTTSIIRLRLLRCTLIRDPFSSAFNFLALMLFVGNFFFFFPSKEGFKLHGAFSFCVCLLVFHTHTFVQNAVAPHRSTSDWSRAHARVWMLLWSCVESARPPVTPVPSGRCLPCLLVDKRLFLCKSQTCIVFIYIKVICLKR